MVLCHGLTSQIGVVISGHAIFSKTRTRLYWESLRGPNRVSSV